MRYILLGMIAFVFMLLYDLYTLRNERRKKSNRATALLHV